MRIERDAANVTKDDLQAIVASSGHDMKSPITSLLLAIESLVSTLQDDLESQTQNSQVTSSQRQALGTCVDAFDTIMHLNMIVNRSVDYCKILANLSLTPSLRSVHVKDCVEQVINASAAVAEVAVTLSIVSSNVPIFLLTDAFWLQVSTNVGVSAYAWQLYCVCMFVYIIFTLISTVSFIARQDNLLCVVGNACKYSQRSRVDGSSSGITVTVHCVLVGGRKLVEFSVQDASPHRITPVELKALYNRPVIFKRAAVGGMGTGMCCLAARVQALGGDCGARLRTDGAAGTVVWFRVPLVEQSEGGVEGDSAAFDASALSLTENVRPHMTVRGSMTFVAKKFDNMTKLIRGGSSGASGRLAAGAGGGEGEVPLRESRRLVERANEEKGDERSDDVGSIARQSQVAAKDKDKERDEGKRNDEGEDKDRDKTAGEDEVGGGPAPPPASPPITFHVPVSVTASMTAPDTTLSLEHSLVPVSRQRPGLASITMPASASVVTTSSFRNQPLQGRTILVVDDAPTIVKMVVRMLTAAGATVDFAKDGREGLEVFKAAHPAFDMVVTDIQVLATCSLLGVASLVASAFVLFSYFLVFPIAYSFVLFAPLFASYCRCLFWMAGVSARPSARQNDIPPSSAAPAVVATRLPPVLPRRL